MFNISSGVVEDVGGSTKSTSLKATAQTSHLERSHALHVTQHSMLITWKLAQVRHVRLEPQTQPVPPTQAHSSRDMRSIIGSTIAPRHRHFWGHVQSFSEHPAPSRTNARQSHQTRNRRQRPDYLAGPSTQHFIIG